MVEVLEQTYEANAAFGQVAPYYDMLMEGVPYRFWAKYLHTVWNHHKLQPTTVLDLACGTGTVALILAREGKVVTGVDIAQPMLDQAVIKARAAGLYIDFHCQDATKLDLNGRRFDSVISLFDSLNNIIDPEQLLECFRKVRRHLSSGGLFIFDLNTAYAFEEGMFDQKSHPADGPLQYHWTSTYDKYSAICTVTMRFTYNDREKAASSFEEVHYQRAYEGKELIEMLQTAGFKKAFAYDAYSLSPAKKRSDRIFLVAINGKGS